MTDNTAAVRRRLVSVDLPAAVALDIPPAAWDDLDEMRRISAQMLAEVRELYDPARLVRVKP